jgi:hypothetical protein
VPFEFSLNRYAPVVNLATGEPAVFTLNGAGLYKLTQGA